MKKKAVPHSVLAGISFSGVSAATLFDLVMLFPKSPFWKAFRGRVLVIASIIMFAIIFPSLTSAMTGYTAAAGDLIGINDIHTTVIGNLHLHKGSSISDASDKRWNRTRTMLKSMLYVEEFDSCWSGRERLADLGASGFELSSFST